MPTDLDHGKGEDGEAYDRHDPEDAPDNDPSDASRRGFGAATRRVAAAYESIADLYAGDEPAEEDPAWRAACRELFTQRLPGPHILEVGCGPGTDSIAFAVQGLDVTAIDVSARFVEITRERVPSATVRRMDMTALSFDDAAFDGIYAFASLLHIPADVLEVTLQGFRRVLRSGGAFFAMSIDSAKVESYVKDDWGGVEGNRLPFYCHPRASLAQMLRDVGFTDVETHSLETEVYRERDDLRALGVEGYQIVATATSRRA